MASVEFNTDSKPQLDEALESDRIAHDSLRRESIEIKEEKRGKTPAKERTESRLTKIESGEQRVSSPEREDSLPRITQTETQQSSSPERR